LNDMQHAIIEPRPDGQYNFVYGGLTLAVLDDRVYQGLGLAAGQTVVTPDLFGALALTALFTGGQAEYIRENVSRVFGEQ